MKDGAGRPDTTLRIRMTGLLLVLAQATRGDRYPEPPLSDFDNYGDEYDHVATNYVNAAWWNQRGRSVGRQSLLPLWKGRALQNSLMRVIVGLVFFGSCQA